MDGDLALNHGVPRPLAGDLGTVRCSDGWKWPLLGCQRHRLAD